MPLIPSGFCSGSYTALSPNIDAERSVNLYCEQNESAGAKSKVSLLLRPGRKVFCTLPEPKVPSLFYINGRCFAAGSNVYELMANGAKVNRGSLGALPVLPTQIEANETQLLVLNNGNLFVFTLATNTLVAVDMTQFNGPIAQIGFADGYFLATLVDSHTFQQSNLEDGTTWDGLNIATVSYFPDNFTSFKVNDRYPIFFSGKKAIVYYNAGAGFPVFIPIQGAYFESGAAAAFATTRFTTGVGFITQDERGSLVARVFAGYNSSERVSTHAVELAWQQYQTATDAIGYSFQMNGHEFWVIYFPTANATWVYDITSGFWSEWAFWEVPSGSYVADRGMSHVEAFGMHLVGDWASGNVYQLDSSFYDDFGNPLKWLRRWPTNSPANKWGYYKQIEFDVQLGDGPQPPFIDGNGQPRPPQMMLRWSNTAGKTWSNSYVVPCGMAGDYSHRAIRRMLGRGRKRVWELSGSDPVPWYFADSYVEAEWEMSAAG